MKKLFLKSFLISSFSFILGTFIIFFVVTETSFIVYGYFQGYNSILLNGMIEITLILLKICIISGISLGLIFSFGTLIPHYFALKRLKYSDIDNYNVHQVREVEIPYSYIDAYNFCLKSLDMFYKSKIVCQDIESGYIKAKAMLRKSPFGENIEFNLTKIDDLHTKIKIQSKPPYKDPIVGIDYGKNLENVEAILEYISTNKTALMG